MAGKELLTLDNAVFAHYAFHTGLAGFKMILVSGLANKARLQTGVFENQEDADAVGGGTVAETDEKVERYRRIHLHDLENIPLFALVGLLYVTADPAPQVALWHFRMFTIGRVCHSLSYRFKRPRLRFLGHAVGVAVTVSMIIKVLRTTKHFF